MEEFNVYALSIYYLLKNNGPSSCKGAPEFHFFQRSHSLSCSVNTNYSTGLDMCEVCTEAVHCVAL